MCDRRSKSVPVFHQIIVAIVIRWFEGTFYNTVVINFHYYRTASDPVNIIVGQNNILRVVIFLLRNLQQNI